MTPRPITPERYDTGPISVDDDDNQAMAKLFARNAIAQGFAVEYAGKMYHPPRTQPTDEGDLSDLGLEAAASAAAEQAEPAEPPSVEREVDLGADDEPRHIHITTRDGHRHTLDVCITVASSRLSGWYLARMAEVRAKLTECKDEDEAQELARQLGAYQQKQITLSVPNLPPDLLANLSTHKFGQLMETINLMMTADQVSSPSPNGRAARS